MTVRSEAKEGKLELNYACLVVLFAILLGGGTEQNLWSDHLIQVLISPLLFLGFYRLPTIKLSPLVWAILALSILLVSLEFLPIHRELKLPNSSDAIISSFWTASPSRTIESTLFYATCVGLFLYISSISRPSKIRLLKFILVGVLIQTILLIFQLSYSSGVAIFGLLPFTIRSGLFANENHFSALLFSSIPILGFIFLSVQDNKKLFLICSISVIALLFAIDSRAGMTFAIIQFVLTLLWFFSKDLNIITKLTWFIFIVIIGGVSLYFIDLSSVLESELRAEIFENTWHAFKDNWLFGSGLGTFVLIYPSYESVDQVFSYYYVNHAHNDHLELLLELGVMVIFPILLYVYAITKNIFTQQYAGVLGIALIAIIAHSLIDYPLRTFSVAIMFVAVSAIIFQKED